MTGREGLEPFGANPSPRPDFYDRCMRGAGRRDILTGAKGVRPAQAKKAAAAS